MSRERRLLLISNSTCHGEGYLDHAMEEILDFLGPVRRMLFVPFALYNREAYGTVAAKRLAHEGIECRTLTADHEGLAALSETVNALIGIEPDQPATMYGADPHVGNP